MMVKIHIVVLQVRSLVGGNQHCLQMLVRRPEYTHECMVSRNKIKI
jgi:hypothetical protein